MNKSLEQMIRGAISENANKISTYDTRPRLPQSYQFNCFPLNDSLRMLSTR